MGKIDIIRQLSEHFRQQNIRNVVILTDENVEKYYPDYFSDLSGSVAMDKIILSAGEQTKSMDTAIRVWNYLAENKYDRNVFLLNFGGGMVTDLGGFVASTYKRGIRFANVPTTLLAMIDAAIGGKTGVNLHYLKNGIGTFYFPDIQLSADISLLNTLPEEELLSGFGEMVKYALVGSADLFRELSVLKSGIFIKLEFVDFCVAFKQKIVEEDPHDRHLRHILNFGHTIGHAIESCCAEEGKPLKHGIAVAQGLYYESLLSAELGHLPQEEWREISEFLTKHFDICPPTSSVFEKWMSYMLNDKKNHDGLINFTLLEHIGQATPDFQIPTNTLFQIGLRLGSDHP